MRVVKKQPKFKSNIFRCNDSNPNNMTKPKLNVNEHLNTCAAGNFWSTRSTM